MKRSILLLLVSGALLAACKQNGTDNASAPKIPPLSDQEVLDRISEPIETAQKESIAIPDAEPVGDEADF